MPNYFCLYRKGDDTKARVKFTDIDNELCAHLGVEVHPDRYHYGWYDSIGLALALGKSWDEMRELWKDDVAQQTIIDWFEAHFDSDAWYQVR